METGQIVDAVMELFDELTKDLSREEYRTLLLDIAGDADDRLVALEEDDQN